MLVERAKQQYPVKQQHYPFALNVEALKIPVILGVTEDERRFPQEVTVWVRVYYSEPPAGMAIDHSHYLCYDEMCQAMLKRAMRNEFHLIEYLTAELYSTLRDIVPDEAKIWLKIHKDLPPSLVGYMVEGASATYTDLPPGCTVIQGI